MTFNGDEFMVIRLDYCEIGEIAKKYDMEFMVYFGSYQTKFYNKNSDIDIGILSSRCLDTDKLMKLLEELIIFHRKSEIDLVDLRSAEPILRYEIAKDGKLLYEREEGLFERYRLFYIKRFYELTPLIEEELNRIKNSIKEVLARDR